MYATKKKQMAYLKRWRRENPEKMRAMRARYRAKHPNAVRDWKQRNPRKVAAYNRKRRKERRKQ